MLYDFNRPGVEDTYGQQSKAKMILKGWHDCIFNMIELFLNRELMNIPHGPISWGKQTVMRSQVREKATSDGVLVCLVGWLTTWLERPPTEAELLELDFSDDEMERIKNWMAVSYLQDRIWIPPVAENMVDATRLPYKKESQRGDDNDLNGWPFVVVDDEDDH
jgi:hypothetical protein